MEVVERYVFHASRSATLVLLGGVVVDRHAFVFYDVIQPPVSQPALDYILHSAVNSVSALREKEEVFACIYYYRVEMQSDVKQILLQ